MNYSALQNIIDLMQVISGSRCDYKTKKWILIEFLIFNEINC